FLIMKISKMKRCKMESKERSYIEVMQHIPDGATIGTTSFGIGGLPEQLIVGLGKYYKKHKHPKEITFSTTAGIGVGDRKSTRLNSSHVSISYAVFCVKKKNNAQKSTEVRQQPQTRADTR